MKKLIIGTALATALAAPALAADLPARAPIARAPVVAVPIAYNWSGFYVGAHVGGAWGEKDWQLTEVGGLATLLGAEIGASESHNLSGWLGGVQAGFNVQAGQWVFGVEAQWSWTNADGDFDCDTATGTVCKTKVNWLGTVAGRVGIAFDRVLVYVKGGWAFVDEKYRAEVPSFDTFTDSHNRNGWMVGAGLEFALAGNWTGKIEYNYMDLGSKEVTLGTADDFAVVDVDQVMHVVKFGINYRFGGPVVARY